MDIEFKVRLILPPGHSLYMVLEINKKIENSRTNELKMNYDNLGEWSISLNIRKKRKLRYNYLIKDSDGRAIYEAGTSRLFKKGRYKNYTISDEWRICSDETPFLSNAFKNVFYKRWPHTEIELTEGNIKITCSANNLRANQLLLITGNCEELGNWDLSRSKSMYPNGDNLWEISLDQTSVPLNFQYKFVVLTNEGNENLYLWEHGENRELFINELNYKRGFIINHFTLNLPAYKPRYQGLSVPVFSLRSTDSCGIGDLGDLMEMVDFISKTDMKIIQILPINDTTAEHSWRDSYPYAAISVYAIHPIYASLYDIGIVNDQEFMHSFQTESKRLNQLQNIDYEAVESIKWEYLRRIYQQEGEETFKNKSFKKFFKSNSKWLKPYAAFCYLRDLYGNVDFKEWPDYNTYNKKAIKELLDKKNESYAQIAIHYFVQYHLDKQLRKVRDYANSKGIILKGDIPIGVNRNSVETWVQPYYFDANSQAGAPPDQFSETGQNWGFPTYNWERLANSGYSWWIERLRNTSKYFDAYRIDHILGFFRIWEIPYCSLDGVLGHFNPALPFTVDEIKDLGYDRNIQADCQPYIPESILNLYFGDEKSNIISEFLESDGLHGYKFKEKFDTQRKLNQYLPDNNDPLNKKRRDGLMALYREVLFVQDTQDTTKYHPAISAKRSMLYGSLSNSDKERYDTIYDDFFYRRNNDCWRISAMEKLPPLLSSTGMLACAEDLGMIPSCVPGVMRDLSLMTLEIERMPKNSEKIFSSPEEYPYLSVCTTGTHDMNTIRAWWEEKENVRQYYYNHCLGEVGKAPVNCSENICKKILARHLSSPSMFTILPIQDWLSISPKYRSFNPSEERINNPDNPNHYWNYRIKPTIQELIEDQDLISDIAKLITKSK